MSSLLDNAKLKLSNLIKKEDIKKDSDVEKWLLHISKLDSLKSNIANRIKILSSRYNDLIIDKLDMSSELFTFYNSNENRIEIVQSYLDYNETLKEISNSIWKEEYKNLLKDIDEWSNIIDKTKSRVLKFQDDLEDVILLADKVKNLKEHLSTVKNPSAQDKNELTASIARLQDLETNMDKYRNQARSLVKTLIESRFESCDKVMLGLLKLEKMYFEKMSAEVKTNLIPLINNLEASIGEDIHTEHEEEEVSHNNSKPQARVADPLDSLSDILGSVPVSSNQVSQPGSIDPLNDLFGISSSNNNPTRTAPQSNNTNDIMGMFDTPAPNNMHRASMQGVPQQSVQGVPQMYGNYPQQQQGQMNYGGGGYPQQGGYGGYPPQQQGYGMYPQNAQYPQQQNAQYPQQQMYMQQQQQPKWN